MHGLPNLKICIAKQAEQIFHYKEIISERFPMSLFWLSFVSIRQSSQKSWLRAQDMQKQSPINLKLLISKFWIAQTTRDFQ